MCLAKCVISYNQKLANYIKFQTEAILHRKIVINKNHVIPTCIILTLPNNCGWRNKYPTS